VPENLNHEGSPRLLTIDQIARKHGVSRSTVHTYRRGGTFPRPVPVEGTTRVLFDPDEVEAWFKANPKRQGSRTDLAEKHPQKPQQGDPVSTTTDPREWRLTPKTLDLFVRALVNEVDYDIHKNYECGEEDGLDHYPELVAEAAEMLDAITSGEEA
jgi:predicted DNA-binding transcriptional regulator AlpA